MEKIVGLKELRENIEKYILATQKGETLIVLKRSRPVFKITPLEQEEGWEEVIDFTKIRKGGVDIQEILARL